MEEISQDEAIKFLKKLKEHIKKKLGNKNKPKQKSADKFNDDNKRLNSSLK